MSNKQVEIPEGMMEAVNKATFYALDDAAIRRVLEPALQWKREAVDDPKS